MCLYYRYALWIWVFMLYCTFTKQSIRIKNLTENVLAQQISP